MSSETSIVAVYQSLTPGSKALAEQAIEVFPSGITHDSRFQKPYGLSIERAKGSRKWDVNGNEYVDYIGGHGGHIFMAGTKR